MLKRLRHKLFEPVDAASLVVFRMMFGAVLFWEVWRFFENDWIRLYYIVRTLYFKYYGFEWVSPWPGDWMYVHFVAVGIFALCVMAGFMYRITSWLLFLGFTYWFLLDETRYLNHLYLTSLLAFLLAVVPAHRAKSVDAWLRPEIRSETVPTWSLWLLRAQMAIVYFFAGIAKLNGDWLRAEPIRRWLARRDDYPLIGSLLASEPSAWFFAYGGLLFDLLIVPFLLWKRTRVVAFIVTVLFHVTNKWLFGIGIFGALATAGTLLFFSPSWPRKVGLFFGPRVPGADSKPDGAVGASSESTTTVPSAGRAFPKPLYERLVLGFVIVYLAVQVFMPLRHFLYPGTVHWTEEGHRFAWHMKLREKRARTPIFYATDPSTGESWIVPHRDYLSSAQTDRVGRWPDMSLQFAHYLAEQFEAEGRPGIEIRTRTLVSLNGRDPQFLINPNVDLTKLERNLRHAEWLVPLTQPLRPERPDDPDELIVEEIIHDGL